MKYAIREYKGKNVDLSKLSSIIENYFREENFVTQSSQHPRGYVIQAKKGGIFRTILGMDRAFTIVLVGDSSDFKVQIGVGKWLQDLGVAAIEAFLITPVVAFVEVPESLWSFELEHEFWQFLENQINLGIQ
ncbi:TVG0593813 [Thermoplasma volcanium GSS1]|uniref:TVG0593813 protein n=1 Tax=Thermoplasma volcanium (strain ATCC 51530 / DSM 4299 / JCM 9571 / NBRC 15438 / GSS1) TaxID=273116 RepID=Q97B56_THEVO|nr:hypothetical protein [Thermoplasma volcanium]BAB59744.1 TVG0593813 [Thermoplasma volcanium GSS1]